MRAITSKTAARRKVVGAITFNFLDKTSEHLPDPHTCTHELDLPAYNSKAELLEKLRTVLDSFEADASFGQE